MSLSGDLLEQARGLARQDPRRPKQASLRRAASAAYYALFHLLVREASASLVTDPGLRSLVARAFDHGEMRQVCRAFLSGPLPDPLKSLVPGAVPADLTVVVQAFIRLQQARHTADYDVSAVFSRSQTVALIGQSEQAAEAWQRVRGDRVATIFLASLLLHKRWNR